MSRALTKYSTSMSSTTTIIGLVLLALLIWFSLKNRVAQYNEERVVIERDSRGRIAAMSVHRSAK